MPITPAPSMLKCPSASISWAATFVLAGGIRARPASSVERVSPRGIGQLPDEVGRIGDVAAMAALRRQLLGRDRLRGPARDPGLVPRPDPRPPGLRRVQADVLGLRNLGRVVAVDCPGSAPRPTRSSRPRRSLFFSASAWASRGARTRAAPRPPALHAHARGALQRRQVLGRPPPLGVPPRLELARRRGDRIRRELDHARDRRAGQKQHGGDEQEHGGDVPRTLPASVFTTQSSVSPIIPPRGLDPLGVPPLGAARLPGRPEHPRREPERDERKADRAGAERPHRRAGRAAASRIAPAAASSPPAPR